MNGKGYSLYPYQYHIPWVHATKTHSNDESQIWARQARGSQALSRMKQ